MTKESLIMEKSEDNHQCGMCRQQTESKKIIGPNSHMSKKHRIR